MRIAYFDCFAGISGDMCLGALIDAGVSADDLSARLAALNVPGWRLEVSRVSKRGISATKVNVLVDGENKARRLPDILEIIDSAELAKPAKSLASRIFTRLAEAEAKVHGVPMDHVHFHEVGAVDAIVDVVGTSVALNLLDCNRILSSPLPSFHGLVKAAHGVFPLPAPAAAELIKGIPIRARDVEGELVTPTGAAIITTVADAFGPIPSMRFSSIGYGAGSTDFDFPNTLRIIVGETEQAAPGEEVSVIETNIDDLNPEFYDTVMDQLFRAGALDVFLTPVQMKKSRPGTLVTALCARDVVDRIAEVLFRETSTIGVRISEARRLCLDRAFERVATPYGKIGVKVSLRDGTVRNAAPEYEDCKSAAESHGVPVKEVYAAAVAAYRATLDGS